MIAANSALFTGLSSRVSSRPVSPVTFPPRELDPVALDPPRRHQPSHGLVLINDGVSGLDTTPMTEAR
jgi:hypothetical protein